MQLTLTPGQPVATRVRSFFAPNPATPTYPVYPDPFAGRTVANDNHPAPFCGTIAYKGTNS